MAVSLVDVGKRPPALAELRRFSQRFGAATLLDKGSAAYASAGLGYLRMDDAEIMRRLADDPRLLRLPLVRRADEVTVGIDEDRWREWQRRP